MDRPVKFINSNTIRVLIILDIIFFVFIIIFSLSNQITETIYSKTIYPTITYIISNLFGLVRFSFTELIIISLILFIPVRIALTIYRVAKKQRTFKNILKHFLKQIFMLFSVMFIWFYLFWGFNYFRIPLEIKTDNIEVEREISEELFDETLLHFIERTNELYNTHRIRPEYNFRRVDEVISENMFNTLREIDNAEVYPSNKTKVFLTDILEYTNTLGFISPFTLESHISKDLLESEIPFITAHEKAHMFGYANETEANYIAFIACVNSGDTYFQYSAYISILRYFLLEYRRRHTEEDYEQIYYMLEQGVRDEYTRAARRSLKYDTFFSRSLNSAYDLYLKLNSVPGGVQSYSRVIQMIMKSDYLTELKRSAEIEILN